MLIWRGWGILVAVFGFGGLIAMEFLVDGVGGDGQTGERVEVKSEHPLFWIRMEHWGAVLVVAGAVMVVLGLLP